MTITEFTAKAEQVEQDTGFELMDVYSDGTKQGWTWDDGFYHYTQGINRASYDVDSMDKMTAGQQIKARQKLRQAWDDSTDIQAQRGAEPYTTQEFAEAWRGR